VPRLAGTVLDFVISANQFYTGLTKRRWDKQQPQPVFIPLLADVAVCKRLQSENPYLLA
jgi:hypothetical protein